MADTTRLHSFNGELTEFKGHVTAVNNQLKSLRDLVIQAERVADAAEDAAADVEQVRDIVDNLRDSTKALGSVGALKPIANVLVRVLDSVDRVAARVQDRLEQIDDRIDRTRIPEKLDRIHTRLDTYIGRVDTVEGGVQSVLDASADTEDTIRVLEQIPLGDRGEGLARFVGDLVAPPTVVLAAANDGVDFVKREVSDAIASLNLPNLDPVLHVSTAMDKMLAALKPVTGPLGQIAAVFKPLADLSDLVYRFTVGPLVDWAMESLGIDRVVARLEARILAALPGIGVLDEAAAAIDGVGRTLDELLAEADPVGVDGWIASVQSRVLGPLQGNTDRHLMIGSAAAQTLTGDNSANAIHGGAGNDTLQGLGGDDVLVGGPGNDVIDGGAGTADAVVFSGGILDYRFEAGASAGVTVFTQVRAVAGRPSDGVDRVSNVETVIFSDAHLAVADLARLVKVAPAGATTLAGTAENDFLFGGGTAIRITGGAGNDMLRGSPRNDTLEGGDGDDVFVYSAGSDSADGGNGADTWRLPAQTGAFGTALVWADITATSISMAGAGSVRTSSVESVVIEHAVKSAFFGNASVNRFTGGPLDDLASGLAGNDEFDGGDGDDLLIGGEGSDVLLGGAGDDTLVSGQAPVQGQGDRYDGGDGLDTLSYQGLLTAPLALWMVGVDAAWAPQVNGKVLRQPASGPVAIDAGRGVVDRLGAGGQVLAQDIAVGIERFVASDGDDRLTGGDGQAVLLDGGLGNDRVRPGIGNHFSGGEGSDTLDLTRSDDVVWYFQVVTGIKGAASVLNAYRPDPAQRPEGGLSIERNTFIGQGSFDAIEHVVGGHGDDFYQLLTGLPIDVDGGTGDDHFNVEAVGPLARNYSLLGAAGHDRFSLGERVGGQFAGGDGDDRFELRDVVNALVLGGEGDDVVQVMAGTFMLEGGGGNDLLQFLDSASSAGVTVDLAAGTVSRGASRALSGTVNGVETVLGQDGSADILRGAAAGEVLVGLGGNDLIEGRGGRDALYGGDGSDRLVGDDGDDLLHGGPGADTLSGGAGIDTASWAAQHPGSDAGAPVVQPAFRVLVDLQAGTATELSGTGGQTVDRLDGIENLIGGSLDDTLSGDGQANLLDGGAGGADQLIGRGGDDVLLVDGNDIAFGGEGDDRFVAGNGNNRLDGGPGRDSAHYPLAQGDYTLQRPPGGIVVHRSGANEQPDQLVDVERLHFSDGSRAFDLDGNAGLTVRLLGAVFGSGFVHDARYAGIGIAWLDSGTAPREVALAALEARLGPAPAHGAIVDLLYTHVVGQAPDAAARQHFVGLLDSGQHTPATLTLLAAEHELTAQLVGLAGLQEQGLAFIGP